MIYPSDSLSLFHSTRLGSYSLLHGFGTKSFGDARNITYLQEYLRKNKIEYTHLVQPHQTHSVNVTVVTSDSLVDKVVNIPAMGL